MGLDCSHDAWSGAYSAFARWREEITTAAEVAPVFSKYEMKNFSGEWDTLPPDMLFVLLVHSDCDGEIKPEHCEPIAKRLEELLPRLTGDRGGHIGNITEKTNQFISGLREAAKSNEPLEFG